MQVLRDEGVRPLVVSGSAAVYGLPEAVPVAETAKPAPINPYGRTKLILEWMLGDFACAHKLPWVALRYFNAAGADPEGEIGEWHDPETHLIPNILHSLTQKKASLKVFGDDYPTPDGTCIRDYIHVNDLAKAHVLALEYLLSGNPSTSINLGTGHGASVREIIAATERVTKHTVDYTVHPRRPGDPARLVADAKKAAAILGWKPESSSIDDILASAWRWECTHSR